MDLEPEIDRFFCVRCQQEKEHKVDEIRGVVCCLGCGRLDKLELMEAETVGGGIPVRTIRKIVSGL